MISAVSIIHKYFKEMIDFNNDGRLSEIFNKAFGKLIKHK